MTQLPSLPDVGDDEPYVSFTSARCRACDEGSPWEREEMFAVTWTQEHAKKRGPGHDKFHVYGVSRSTARTYL